MTIFSTMRRAGIPVLACLLALPALADEPGGLVTGSFGDQPLELTVAPELSGATIIGNYADASLLAAQMEGDQDSLTLTLEDFTPGDGIVALKGTLTGQVSGGPTSETRPVIFSFDTRLEELD
ncbi:hypothetical protein PVW53_21125 [Seohaeicola sp. SP36]|uniref:hypothetical protein n=1 Tax=unclassified Seohaeicola TaxID=2641111 RepID=UPI00237B5723|nr:MULTISPECIES: hypothetical protein [unclassified Seohaeicola]MDD9709775.1 hypothetical protein [Seohaeicola sp. 4SK31]MDD9738009.1 hypothetical protein [Seohaeicola sp. SP36]